MTEIQGILIFLKFSVKLEYSSTNDHKIGRKSRIIDEDAYEICAWINTTSLPKCSRTIEYVTISFFDRCVSLNSDVIVTGQTSTFLVIDPVT